MSLFDRNNVKKAMGMKRFTVSLSELQAAEAIAKKGGRIPKQHFDAYCAMMSHVAPAHWYPNDPADRVAHKVILSGPEWGERVSALHHIRRKDYYIATGGMLFMANMLDDNTYRIRLTGEGIEVVCFGLESVDSKLEGHYDGVDDLPDWVKERLAVLMVLDSTPPTGELEGVGRRISEKVFWVYAPTTASGASTSA